MAIVNDSGGSERRPDRREKDDVYTPVHKTEDFREVVRRIKEKDDGRPITPSIEEKRPTFNVPLPKGRGGVPAEFYKQKQEAKREDVRETVKKELYSYLDAHPGTTITNVNDYIEAETEMRLKTEKNKSSIHDSSTSRHASRVQGVQDRQQVEQIRQEVIKTIGAPPPGVSKEKYQERVEQETKRLVDIIKRPRYVYLSDGTPYYLNKEDERAELEKSLLGESTWKKKWTLAKYDIANGVSGLTTWIGSAAVRTKELITDTSEKGNVAGGIINLGFNSALLGWEYLRAAVPEHLVATEEKYKQLERDAAAAKYTDPKQAEFLQAEAGRWKKLYESKVANQERMAVAGRAVDNAWQTLFTEVKESNEFAAEHYDPDMVDPETGRPIRPLEQQMMYERKQRELAQKDAGDLRTQATQAYADGDFEKSIELTKQAQEADRNARLADPYGAYTWAREPERYAKFKEDAALLELQKGEPLNDEEIRRLKEYHANAWTEITGEFVFDPVNLIPAAAMEKIYGIPLKGAVRIAKAVDKEVPIIGKTIKVMGSPVTWMFRQSITAGGNKVKRTTYNIFNRISNAYTSSEEVTKAIDEISNAVLDANRAPTSDAARAIFEQARKDIPGLQQVTFKDFQQLSAAADQIDPTEWGKMYSDALTGATEKLSEIEAKKLDLMDDAAKQAYVADDALADLSGKRWALEDVAEKFESAFVDPHRIHKGSRLMEDTVGGWITRTMRELSDEEVSAMLETTKFHEWAKNVKLGDNVKAITKAGSNFIEASLAFAAKVRDVWAGVVLTTPRWPINNLIDTSMRSMVYGGDIWDDLHTLWYSTQRQLADDIGFSPLEFDNALARHGVDFTERVPHKLLYEGWKPKFGLFSYIGEEYRRLAVKGADGSRKGAALVKPEIIKGILDKLPDPLRRNLGAVADGMNYRGNPMTILGALSGGVQDFNTAIEFTFRLRMFHTEYNKLLTRLEPKFAERGMDALTPATREIAKQIWSASEGNPRKITAYVDNLLGGAKNTPASWSVTIPKEVETILGKMDAGDKQLFMSSVKAELDEFVETAARNGKELKPDDFKKFFDDYKTKMQDEIQHRMSMAHDNSGIDMGIRTDGTPNKVPTEDDIQGSLPIPKDESPRNKLIEEATSRLTRKKKFRKTVDIHNDFETAISDYAKVERVSGDGVRVVKKGNDLVVEVGDKALKKGATAYINQVNDAVISIFKHQDADLIAHSGFASSNQYETVMREFFADPTAVLNKDERQFLTLVNQMENHPHLRQIIEQTSPETVRKYDSALDVYRDLGEYSDVYGFNQRPDQIMMSEAEKIRPVPGSHVAAANESRVATRKLVEVSKGLEPEIADVARDFVDQFMVFRQELKQFYSFTYPGPLMRATTEGARHSGWDLFYRLSEAEFLNEAKLKNQVIDLLQKDPQAAKKIMEEANGDFAEFFLKQNGIELEWDAERQMILNIKVKGLDGKIKNFTSRRDIANLHIRFFSPQAKKSLLENPVIKIRKDAGLQLRRQLRNALRDTFQTDTAHAEAWSKVIHNHAEKWAAETGQPIEAYFERLGFQRVDSASAKGLGTMEQTRIVKRGAIKKQEDGSFMFYGLSHSNFESMVRETGVLFYDDLASMAEHSAQAADDLRHLKTFLEAKTGKPIRAGKLEQAHSDVLSDVFSSYIATGHGPDIKIKNGFDRLKKWMTQTFDAVRDSKVAGEIPDDTYRVLDRMFTEAQLFDVPKSNARAIRLMAKDADLVADSEDDLLKIINDALAQPNLTPEQTTARQALEETLRVKNDELTALNDRINGADDAMREAFMVAHGSDLRFAQDELTEAQAALENFDAGLPKNTQTYATLGDVPKDVAARLLGTPEQPLESAISKELQEGWDVWKTQRGLGGFPDEALTDPDTFKAHLKQRMGEEWGEVENHYNRLLWEVEQFEDAMLTYHAGDDLRTVVFPRVHEAQMSNGMKTFIRNQSKMVENYDIAIRALDNWGEYAGKVATEGHPAQLLTKEEQAALKAWAMNDGSKAKAELIETVLNGNDDIQGAIPLVNKRMLDYQATNQFDQFMKNFFPFWMFPSRSFPFWAETLATHPQLIAGYEKLQRLSRSQRYQSGAVTSKGKPLPSLDGYVKLPGTDMWFNPLAPFSFRYLLDVQKSKDDILYAAQSEDDIDPKAFVASELMQNGQIYGFSLAPWAAWTLKKQFGIPDEIIPRYPLIPEIQLFPRWMMQDMIQKMNKVNLFGQTGFGDKLYPEVPWHDYMVERRILENALQQIQSGKLSEADKLKIMSQAQNAIKNKGDNALWQSTYKEYTGEEADRSQKSMFSGFYVKEFGDGEADLLALRNELNMIKSALNNEFQSEVFDLPVDAETGWKNYLNKMDTPEGWVHRLYTDIGWVKNGEGDLVRDPKDRARWLATKIEQDEDQQMYYDKMADLQTELNKRLRALPVGADWEQAKIVYDWYSNEAESLDYLKTFEKVYGSNKPVELIQQDIARDWFRKLKATQPNWNYEGGETYEEYQQRVMDWEQNLPNIAPLYMRAYMRRRDLVSTLGSLHEDQQFNTGEFFNQLVGMSTTDGLLDYEKQSDDVFDALNKAWKATYWDTYWNSVIGKSGYEVDLAEKDFYSQHQQPPSTDELYQWIAAYYGPEKFTRDEITKWAEGGDTLDIEERQLQGKDDPADYKKRQEIWDMLSWIGPGNKNRGVFETAYANAGGDPDWLTTWYQESGEAYKARNTERLDQLHDSIQQAISALGLKQPERAELVRYIKAQQENDQFKKLVNSELGNQFFDYEDDDGTMQQGVFSYYNSLGYEDRKEFRSSYPDEYDAIQSYYDMKETFQEEHLTWADYYGFETEPSVSLPTNESGSTMTPPALRGSGGKPRSGGGGRGSGKPEARPTYTPYGSDRIPYFNISDRTSTYISPGLYGLVGNKMAWEITNLMSSGRRISTGGVSFLRSVASRYPQYRSEINNILAKGT